MPVNSPLLSRLDMTKDDNVREAERRLNACRGSPDLFRAWAELEGRALILAGLKGDLGAQSLESELEEAQGAADASDKAAEDLRGAIRAFVGEVEKLSGETYDKLPEPLTKAIDDLESALVEV